TARRAVDLTVLGVLFVLALLGFHPVYGGIQYILTGVMALVFATLIALIGARWRWGPLRMTPLLLAVYFLFGSTFAAPTHALRGGRRVGTSRGRRPGVGTGACAPGVRARTVGRRTRRYASAGRFPLALMRIAFAFGTTEAPWPVIRGTLFAVVSIASLTWRFE